MIDNRVNLSPRREGTRDKIRIDVVRFDIDQILGHFSETIALIKSQFRIADELISINRNSDAEYIWRSQIVFLSGALDFYMHELTKYGLCEIYDGVWEKTEKYCNIKISLDVVERALKDGEDDDWFLEYINSYYQSVTMVSNESVKNQLNLLGIDYKGVADSAFFHKESCEKTAEKLKRRLNELFDRRNIIAHQTDRMHYDAQMKSITKETVESFLNDVERIVHAIDAEARKTGL